jgi:hypothetical protein
LVQKSSGSRPDETTKYLYMKNKKQQLPDARLHQRVSFIKSFIRILGYGALWYSLDIAAILLILSEIVGIGEELV